MKISRYTGKRIVLLAAAISVLTAVMVGIGVVAPYLLRNWLSKNPDNLILVETAAPGTISTSTLRNNLQSANMDLVRETLSILAGHKDPGALDLAIPLLECSDDYVWLSAALYAGACGRTEAVPYLIKGLRHTALRADPDAVACLQRITGKSYGSDFAAWQQWWLQEHPGSTFDWESHLGSSPRTGTVATTQPAGAGPTTGPA